MVPTKKEELRNLVTQTTLETYEETDTTSGTAY